YVVSSGATFFETLGIPIHIGRSFSDAEIQDGTTVAVVTGSFAARLWPGENAVGKTFQERDLTWTVIGVSGEIVSGALGEPHAEHVFIPSLQTDFFIDNLLLRVDGNARSVGEAVAAEIARMDPTVPILRMETLRDAADRQIAFQRAFTKVSSGFGVLA